MKRWEYAALAAALSCALAGAARADTALPIPNGYPYLIVLSCGSASFTAGTYRPPTEDITGTACTVGGPGGGGGGGGAVYGLTPIGTAPGKPPLFLGYSDASGLTQGVSPGTELPQHDYDLRVVGATLDATKTTSLIDIPVDGKSVVGLRFAGLTASGATITYFSSNDATQTPASPISSLNASTGVPAGTRTTDGETRIAVSGRTTLRLQVTTAGTGSITVSYNVSRAGTIVDIGSPIPPGSNPIGSTFGPDSVGALPTRPPLFIAGVDSSGNIKPAVLTAASAFTTADALADAALGAPADAAATVGGNGSAIAQLKQAVTQLSNIVTKLTPGTAGTINANQGTPAVVANAWPSYLTQGGAVLSGTNGLPTTDTNAAQSFTAPGTSASKAQGTQGVTGGLPLSVTQTAPPADQRPAAQPLSAATVGNSLIIPINGMGTLGVNFSGLAASGATVSFSATNDPAGAAAAPANYSALGSFNAAAGTASSTYSTDGNTRLDAGAHTAIKITVTAAGTGTITVGYTASVPASLTANTSPLVGQTALGKDIGAVEQLTSPWVTQNNDKTYQLLSNATATGTAFTGIAKASYLFNVIGTFGASCTVTLQALAADGATYQTVFAFTATGTQGVVLGSNSTVRAAITGTCSAMFASLT